MSRHVFTAIITLIGIPFLSWGQTGVLSEKTIWDWCSPLTYIAPKDSLLLQASVDSIAHLMVGRWELLEIAGGWGPNHPPARVTELVLNQQRQGEIYENGIQSARFDLFLTRQLNTIRFKINEPGKPYFNFRFSQRSTGGLIYVCDQKLFISDGRGDGMAYTFRRIPTNRPGRQYANYSATALLNYKPWYGTAHAVKIQEVPGKPCTLSRFSLVIVTDLPYDQSLHESTYQVTGCSGKCTPTQLLSLDNIPLNIGRYEIKDLDTCCATSSSGTRYDRLSGGDAVTEMYLPKYATQIRVTAWNPITSVVEGTFELSLFTADGKYVYFSDGTFKTQISSR